MLCVAGKPFASGGCKGEKIVASGTAGDVYVQYVVYSTVQVHTRAAFVCCTM